MRADPSAISWSVTPSPLTISAPTSLPKSACLPDSDKGLPTSWGGNPASSNNILVSSVTTYSNPAVSAKAEFII